MKKEKILKYTDKEEVEKLIESYNKMTTGDGKYFDPDDSCPHEIEYVGIMGIEQIQQTIRDGKVLKDKPEFIEKFNWIPVTWGSGHWVTVVRHSLKSITDR